MPGETVQPWHTGDGYIHIDMPRPAFGISAFWAFADTTKENGATEILPGSHQWEKERLKQYLKLDPETLLSHDNLRKGLEDEKKWLS